MAKINSDPTDMHGDGATGRVVYAVGPIMETFTQKDGTVVPAGTYGYVVVWDDLPGQPAFITGTRLVAVR